MKKQEIQDILSKYRNGESTEREKALLETWYLKQDSPGIQDLSNEQFAEDLTLIGQGLPLLQVARKSVWPRLAAAASILLFLSAGAYLLFRGDIPKPQISENTIHDIVPGVNKPVLTLANGKTIILDNNQNGLLARQGASVVNRSVNGAVVYQQAAEPEYPQAEKSYNAVTVPRGAEYQVVILPDGTKVWMNAASSLRYPTAFSGDERKVELAGEAYFEVVHNPAKPFRVVSAKQIVEVLGTHFNINTYDDEPDVKTTLLEGKVKVTAMANNAVRYLLPGQQTALNGDGFKVGAADMEKAVAWKNGQFMFQDDNIQYIMRIISRWYDVDVEYKGQVPNDSFGGGVSRFKNISELLNILQLTGKVHFQIEGRKIIVSK
ncbi:DUF4974 domain-containing protein [Mucilaginibacter sp. KACC 22773]|uniref:FecR family protein n=1 Tax=Mucilaginibacter sp. KACC 22773 TaxID=3025671 RepID=UPI0023671750|nr:FecR family protein [Mucilaginibacter sp. KACC 22773]WDF77130.1 DUF4974 domain-containing protein [Mucilaginibacter sp. KACC 22773]